MRSVLLLLALLLPACTGSYVKVDGEVRASSGAAFAEGAEVWLNQPGHRRFTRLGTTDPAGRFGCELPRAMFEGEWEIEVWEPGHAPARIPLRGLWRGSPRVPVRAWLEPAPALADAQREGVS